MKKWRRFWKGYALNACCRIGGLLLYASRRIVKNCEDCAILAQYRLDLSVEKIPQFFILNGMTVNSEKFRLRIQELQARFEITDRKTQELLQQLREEIEIVERITFEE
jgi:hypothetical protein